MSGELKILKECNERNKYWRYHNLCFFRGVMATEKAEQQKQQAERYLSLIHHQQRQQK